MEDSKYEFYAVLFEDNIIFLKDDDLKNRRNI